MVVQQPGAPDRGRAGSRSVGAVVLAGGRAKRLGSCAKPRLQAQGTTLLGLTLRALVDVGVAPGHIVVVGPTSALQGSGFDDITVVREEPAFSGPVAGIAAGWRALAGAELDLVLTVACDMPNLGPGLAALLRAAEDDPGAAAADEPEPEAWVGVTRATVAGGEDRVENLLSLHRTGPLSRVLGPLDPTDMSVRALLAKLAVRHTDLPPGAAADVDTWVDAERLGLSADPDATCAASSASEINP